jgi:ferredoxin
MAHGVLADIERTVAPAGLILRGSFHPESDDKVPSLPDGRPARTVVLVGNAGAAMWRAFAARTPTEATRNPLDDWLRPPLLAAAASVGGHAVFPNEGPPFVPIQQWGARAEPIHRSPIGIMIHPEFGLWHVYRAAILLAEPIDLPERIAAPSPCDACAKKPCLQVCPADAFLPDRFDGASCVTHVASDEGANCRERGCLARRACPVGRDYLYPREAQAFHTAAFVRSARKIFGV